MRSKLWLMAWCLVVLGLLGYALARGQVVAVAFVLGVIAAVVLAAWYWLDRPAKLWARRLEGGLCVRCGYDLRGTPGRCPECGTMALFAPDQHE